MAAFILPGKRPGSARLRNAQEHPLGTIRRVLTCFTAAAVPGNSMKAVVVIMLVIAASGCSTFRSKPYQASDTTASSATHRQAPGPTQRSAQRMFNPDGSLGTHFGT